MTDITLRPYRPEDRAACLALFDGNVPRYFAPDERAGFCRFLDELPETGWPYLVLEEAGQVVACGGLIADEGGRQVSLSWGMVVRSRHRGGLGRRLTLARLDQARAMPGIGRVVIETSQHTRGFYEGLGFRLTALTPDGFGPGIDRCDMVLTLD
ncbi:MAG: GNAT family N-acetyltransferase [Rhodobacteraceae bacterium]|nr:GNAT family N-acetyltransferase [Paracoccaceae bacterium]